MQVFPYVAMWLIVQADFDTKNGIHQSEYLGSYWHCHAGSMTEAGEPLS